MYIKHTKNTVALTQKSVDSMHMSDNKKVCTRTLSQFLRLHHNE